MSENKPLPIGLPKWTVLYNIVSPGSNWVGTGWEFFDQETDATACYERQIAIGNCPTKRPFNLSCDWEHLGAAHRWKIKMPRDDRKEIND